MDEINNELYLQKNLIEEKADLFANKEVEIKDRSNERKSPMSSISG